MERKKLCNSISIFKRGNKKYLLMKLGFKQTKLFLKRKQRAKWAKKEERKYFEVFIKQRMKSVSFTN